MALGKKKKETHLCSSSSSSLVIIDLYWFPLSFPGLYLKENVSSAAGEWERERQRRARDRVSQRPPESNDQQQWACSLELLADPCSCTHTPNTMATPKHSSPVSSSLQKAWAVAGKLCGSQWRAKVLLARGWQESQLQLALEMARTAGSEQPCLEANTSKSYSTGTICYRCLWNQSLAGPSWLIKTC